MPGGRIGFEGDAAAWWLDCVLKCVKKSGVCMVVRLCIEMHSQKIVGLVHLSNKGKYKLLCTSDYFAVASWDFITANIKKKSL